MPRVSIIVLSLTAALSLLAQTPAISNSGVVNSVTRDSTQPIAAGSIVSIFGSQLATTSASADSVPLSMSIAGVSVTFDGVPAAVRLVSPTLISVQVPWEVGSNTTGSSNVVVTQNGVASNTASVAVARFSPGIYAIENLSRSNMARAVNSDGSLAQPAGVIPGLNSHPAASGDTLMVLATGLGPVDSAIGNGAASADVVRNALTQPQVTVAGIGATVGSATLSNNFVGAYQVQMTVPGGVGTSDAAPLQLQIGGATTPVTTTIAVVTPQ